MLNPILSDRCSNSVFLRFITLTVMFIFFSMPSRLFALLPELFQHNTQPVEITSDHANFDETTGNTTYRGNVYAIQKDRQLWSQRLVIHRTRAGKIDHIVAEGSPARFIFKNEVERPREQESKTIPESNSAELYGKAQCIHYYPEEEKILFLKNAELMQNNRLIRGEHLIYFIKNKTLISESMQGSKTLVILQSGKSK